MTLHCNVISHWLDTSTKCSLNLVVGTLCVVYTPTWTLPTLLAGVVSAPSSPITLPPLWLAHTRVGSGVARPLVTPDHGQDLALCKMDVIQWSLQVTEPVQFTNLLTWKLHCCYFCDKEPWNSVLQIYQHGRLWNFKSNALVLRASGL